MRNTQIFANTAFSKIASFKSTGFKLAPGKLALVKLTPLRSAFSRRVLLKLTLTNIEAMRTEMAAREGNIVYFASPKPGSYSPENQDKPVHGRVKEFSYRKAAFNGVNKQWGLFLHNLVKNKPSNNIIEMGTCSGFSGCYIASANNFSKFVTIEVSSELCEIARGHIKKFSERFVAINKLFDDAIDDFLDEGLSGIDIAYIDGHHEKLATLHYFERIKPMLNPDSVVIFDDIYWSMDYS